MEPGDDLVCPECHHSLGLHKYFYGVCDAPLGGTFVKSRCECTVTLYELFKKLMAENIIAKRLKSIEAENNACMQEVRETRGQIAKSTEEVANARKLVEITNERFTYFLNKFALIKEVLEEAKLIETNRFANAYKIKIHEMLDQALELIVEEKPNDNTN